MGYEVELKFRVPEPRSLLAWLDRHEAAPAEAVTQEDQYLSHPDRDFAATDEALRLRREGAIQAITYKGPKHGGPTKTREELEVPFAPGHQSFDDLLRVFERLGFRPLRLIRKSRRPFQLVYSGRAMTVALDDVGDLGTFAEVETLANNEADLPLAQAAVLALAAELGLKEVEPRSYLRMHLERDAAGLPGIGGR
jgi:adenylate cyclase class 2